MRKLLIALGVGLLLIALFFAGRRAYYHYWYYPQQRIKTEQRRETRKDSFYKDTHSMNEIIFLGNSLTEGFDLPRYFRGSNIKNRGIGGDRTTDILNRLDEITTAKPRLVLLMVGINDLHFYTQEQIINNYERIIQIIQKESPDTRIIVQSVLPVAEFYNAQLNQQVETLNQQLEPLAENHQLRYIDLYPFFTQHEPMAELYQPDGVHLAQPGYQLWAGILKEQVFAQLSNENQP